MKRLVIAALVSASLLWTSPNVSTEPTQQQAIAGNMNDTLVFRPKFKPSIKRNTIRYLTFIVTAYTASDSGMNGKAVTYSGKNAVPYHTIAASRQWPIGTTFRTRSGQLWIVDDRGGAINDSNRIDLYVGKHDVSTALQWGVKTVQLQLVTVGKGK